MMKIGIAADHGGFLLKEFLKEELTKKGYDIVDFGNRSLDTGDDYPDFVIPLARSVAVDKVKRGIAVCGSGVGACIAANKIAGVRACLITDNFSAHQGVEDDDMNLVCLGGRITGSHLALEISETFLEATFSGKERHLRRLGKIAWLETSARDSD
jgi:ribose 5-phosphate isomerase B